jgi:cGMP-dependent protein kinase
MYRKFDVSSSLSRPPSATKKIKWEKNNSGSLEQVYRQSIYSPRDRYNVTKKSPRYSSIETRLPGDLTPSNRLSFNRNSLSIPSQHLPPTHKKQNSDLSVTVLPKLKSSKNEGTEATPRIRKISKSLVPVIDERRFIGNELTKEAEHAIVPNQPKNKKDIAIITASLSKHFIFTSLSDSQRHKLIDNMQYYSLNPAEIVLEQGKCGSTFFIVSKGSLDVFVNGERKKTLSVGDNFGELALIHDNLRSATVITFENTGLWGLDRDTFKNALKAISQESYEENMQFLNLVDFFQYLNDAQKEALVNSLTIYKFSKGDMIVREGDIGDLFYIIKEGKVICSRNGIRLKRLGKGDFFGEQGLLYNCKRTATAVADTKVRCLVIGREKLKKVLGNNLQNIIFRNSIQVMINNSGVLKLLTKEQIEKLFQNLEIKNFYEKEVIIPARSHKGTSVWFLIKGRLRKRSGDKIYEELSCIGDKYIIDSESQDLYKEDVIAEGPGVIAVLSKENFQKCIGGDFSQTAEHNELVSVLKQIHLLKSLTPDKLFKLVQLMKIQKYADNDMIIEEENPGKIFYIIKRGTVDIMKNGVHIRTIEKYSYFGERALFDEHRSATVKANGEVECWQLSKNDFLKVLNETIRTQLMKRMELLDDKIELDDLVVVKLLAKGLYSTVFLAIKKSNLHLYVLKTIHRSKVRKHELYYRLIEERNILLSLDNIFITKLIKTFKDHRRVYYLKEVVIGEDLFDVLRKLNGVPEYFSKFYIACMILILETLHEKRIILRSLKPENIKIDGDGYPKLMDLSSAKILIGRTYTMIGTPQYMAPEIIKGNGYNHLADYWSLGVILYEFVCGTVPYGEGDTDPMIIYRKILCHKLSYPKWVEKKFPAKQLVEQLLDKHPNFRTGGGIDNLKRNSWFGDFNWVRYIQDSLAIKELEPPYKPQILIPQKEINTALNKPINMLEAISVISIQRDEDVELDFIDIHPTEPNDWDYEF